MRLRPILRSAFTWRNFVGGLALAILLNVAIWRGWIVLPAGP